MDNQAEIAPGDPISISESVADKDKAEAKPKLGKKRKARKKAVDGKQAAEVGGFTVIGDASNINDKR